MQVHRLIEHLRSSTKLDQECAKLIERSHKFAFNPGVVPDEILDGAAGYARQLMAHEIFPMPFDSCLFELGPSGIACRAPGEPDWIGGDDRLWVLAWRERIDSVSAGWAIYFRTFAYFEKIGGRPCSIAGVGQIFTDGGFDDTGQHGYFRLVGLDSDQEAARKRQLNGYLTDPLIKRHVDEWHQRRGRSADDTQNAYDRINAGGDEESARFTKRWMDKSFNQLLSVLGLMSTSAGVTIEAVLPTKKLGITYLTPFCHEDH